jgi:hypothetical protein
MGGKGIGFGESAVIVGHRADSLARRRTIWPVLRKRVKWGMATAGNVNVPESLLAEVEKAAHEENRSAEDVVKNAIERYLEARGWQKFVENNECRARLKGIGEGDVERLIAEARREGEQRGR